MQAAQLVAPRRFQFIDLPDPTPGPGDVIIRTEYLSICGTDLHRYLNERELPYPLPAGTPCHEAVGIVEESRDSRFAAGQRVIAVVNSMLVERAAVPGDRVVAVPDTDVDPSLWVLCQPAGTVMYALPKVGSVIGDTVVILGQGPIGLIFTEFILRFGAEKVVVVDPNAKRLAAAASLGATHTIDPSSVDVVDEVRRITGGAMADVSIEACGSALTYHQMFQVIHRTGRVVVFGTLPHTGPFEFDWRMAYDRIPNVVVTSSTRAGERVANVKHCVELVAQRRLDLSHLVTHRMPWRELGNAFHLYAEQKNDCLKTVIMTDAAAA